MIKLFAFCLILLSLGEATNPGVSVAISQDALNYAGAQAMDLVVDKVKNFRLPNVSGKKVFEYKVKNMRVSRFTKPNAHVGMKPGVGVNIGLNKGGVRVDGNWEVQFLWSTKTGSFHAVSSNVDLNMGVSVTESNGKPKLIPLNCKTTLGGFEIDTTGTVFGWFLNIIVKMVKGTIREKIEAAVCKELRNVINKNANNELATFNLIASITKVVKLDYHLTKNPVITSSYLASYHKGQFLGDPQSSFNPPGMSFLFGRMVSTSISEDTLNSVCRVLHVKNLIDFDITLRNNDLEKILGISGIDQFSIQLRLYSTKAPVVDIKNGKLTVEGELIVEIRNPKLLLELGVKARADGTAWISGKKILGRIDEVDADATIRENNLGQPISNSDLNEIVDVLIPNFLPKINEYINRGISLPSIEHATFYNYQLKMVDNHIQVAFDVKA